MEKKVYQSRHTLALTIMLEVDGQIIPCGFTGGMNHPRRLNGTYSTSNPKIQDAIESHPRYKKMFDLVKVVQMKPREAPATPVKEQKAEVVELYESEADTGQKAKEELNKRYGVPWSKLKNLAMVDKEAQRLGITYPNWER